MQFLPVLLFTAFLLYLHFGVSFFRLNPAGKPNRLFLALCLLFAHWALFHSLLQSARSAETAMFLYRFSSPGAVFFTGVLVHFFLCLTGALERLKPAAVKAVLFIVYAPAVFFFYAARANLVGAEYFIYEGGAWVGIIGEPNSVSAAYNIWYNALIISCFLLVAGWKRRSARENERKQADIMLVSGAAAFLLTSAAYAFLYSMGLRFPAFGIIFPLIWLAGIRHAVLRYGFLGITPGIAPETILNSLQEAVILTDEKGRVCWTNPAASSIAGRSGEDLKGVDVKALFPGGLPRLEGKTACREPEESFFAGPRGEEIPVSYTCGPIRSEGAAAGYVISFQDISRLKETENSLRQFKDIFDRANFGAAVTGTDGRLEYINEYFAGIHGFSAAEVLGKNLSVFHTAAQMKKVDRLHRELLRSGEYRAREVWHARRDGGEFPMLMNGLLIRDEKGAPAYFAATAIDITERKQSEQALRRGREWFKDVAEAASEYIWEMDADARYTYVSGRVAEVMGRPPEQMLGKTPFDFMPEDEAKKMKKTCGEIFASARPFQGIECRWLLPGGGVVWQAKSGMPVFDSEGKLSGYRGTSLDITRRKRDELALKSLTEERSALLDSVPVHIWYMEDERAYGFANAAHLEFLGLAGRDIRGRDVFEILPSGTAGETVKLNADSISRMRKHTGEQWIPDGKGQKRLLEITRIPMSGENGGFSWLLCVGADITEKRTAEEKIRESLEIKANFISMASHELRTPLTIIKEGLSIVEEGVAGPLTAKQEKILGKVSGSIERLSRLIENVLDYQRLQSGRAPMEISRRDLNELVLDTAQMFRNRAESAGLELNIELDRNMPPAEIDGDKIIQALSNLIDNAVKYTDKGKITVSTSLDGRGRPEIRVSDTGRGTGDIDPGRIFDMFERGADSAREKPGGFGLGLAITREIVLLHGGEIEAEPNPGGGTVFKVRIPERTGQEGE